MSFICSKGYLSPLHPLAAVQSPRTALASPADSVLSLRSGREQGEPSQGFSGCRWMFCNEKLILKSTQCSSILSFGESYFCLSSSETEFQNMGGRDQEAEAKKAMSPAQKRANRGHSHNSSSHSTGKEHAELQPAALGPFPRDFSPYPSGTGFVAMVTSKPHGSLAT